MMSPFYLHATCRTPHLEVLVLFPQCVISDIWREMRAPGSYRATRHAPTPNLGLAHSVPLLHHCGPRCCTIVSKKRGCNGCERQKKYPSIKSGECYSFAPCRYCGFCVFSKVVNGHGTSKPCHYKYINSAIPCSVLWFVEGFKLTNRNPTGTPQNTKLSV
jgi:hypothetical protein